jgi:hypothetical protein
MDMTDSAETYKEIADYLGNLGLLAAAIALGDVPPDVETRVATRAR